MKTYLLIPVIIFYLFLLSQGAQAAIDVNLLLVNQDPYPVEPGGNVNLEIEIQSISVASQNIYIEMVVKDPFTLLPGEERVKVFSKIGAGESSKTSYNLHVDEDAITGIYEIEFKIYTDPTSNISVTKKVTVNVEGKPQLILKKVETIPQQIKPGDTVNVYTSIENIGTGTARRAKMTLNCSTTYILPILSGGQVYIGDITPGSSGMATFLMNVDSSTEYGTYPCMVSVEYTDENNLQQLKIFPSIGLPVKGSVILNVINIELNEQRKKLKIDIANRGTGDAKSLEAKLIIDNTTIGIDYITQLKASKQSTLEFPLIYTGRGKLIITYTGPGTETHTFSREVVLNFEKPSQDSFWIFAVIGLAALAVIYLLLRKKKK